MMKSPIQYFQAAILFYFAIFFTLIVINNITDPEANVSSVRHVMSMDTTFRGAGIFWRAITSTTLQNLAFASIVLIEAICALFCWIGAFKLSLSIFFQIGNRQTAKSYAYTGLFLGFSLYFFIFLVIAGEWFCMWQSPQWNFQTKAGLFSSMMMFAMLFLSID